MSERTFYLGESKARVTAVIREVEAMTSAELVVSVKHASSPYRDASYLVGLALAMATLLAILFLPTPFALWATPIDVAFGFLLGVVLASSAPGLRRILVSRKRREAEVTAAAATAFLARGVSRTKGRNGILVFVSTFERTVVCLPDIGIDVGALGDSWKSALEKAREGVTRLDFDAFAEALRALGPPLAKAMPHQADDVNELPDEVVES